MNAPDPKAMTAEQGAVLRALRAFLAGQTGHIFILTGSAGTGKTTLIAWLAHELRRSGRPFHLLAPTGRAARVLSVATGESALTVHRKIYTKAGVYSTPTGDKDGSFQLIFRLAANLDDRHAVYIVDEASMIPDHRSEGEFLSFGSGRLLHDLLEYTGVGPTSERRIIFVGDSAQLPPVGSSFSPALSAEYLASDGLVVTGRELSEVFRQRETPLLRCARKLRSHIMEKRFSSLTLEEGRPDICPITADEVVPTFMRLSGGNPFAGHTVIIAHSNRSVLEYNRMVRSHFSTDEILVPGERVVVAANNYWQGIELMNGEFGRVVEVSNEVIYPEKEVFVNTGGDKARGGRKIRRVDLRFRRVVLRFPDYSPRRLHNYREIDCLIVDNLLESPEPRLSPLEVRGLFVDFCQRHPYLRRDSPQFKKVLADDPRFNALQLKYGYAVTCHKAQGGEWRQVIVDFSHSGNRLCEGYFRWAYTALTRAREGVFAVNSPHYGILPAPSVHVEGHSAGRVICVPPERIPAEARDNPAAGIAEVEIRRICEANGLRIRKVRRHAYQLDVSLESGGRRCLVTVNWNRFGRISSVRFGGQTPEGGTAAWHSEMMSLKQAVLSTGEEENAGVVTIEGEATVAQRELVDALQNRCEPRRIVVSGAEALSAHHLRCTFSRGGGIAVMDYYFNDRGRCTRLVPLPKQSTDILLLDEVNRLGERADDRG